MKHINEVRLVGEIFKKFKLFDNGKVKVITGTLKCEIEGYKQYIPIKAWGEIADQFNSTNITDVVCINGTIKSEAPPKNSESKEWKTVVTANTIYNYTTQPMGNFNPEDTAKIQRVIDIMTKDDDNDEIPF